jgi:hypothetical protein
VSTTPEPDDLTAISDLAWAYAELALRDLREEKHYAMLIVQEAKAFTPLAMAYFCQQVVSHCPDTHRASAILTAFTNRLTREDQR